MKLKTLISYVSIFLIICNFQSYNSEPIEKRATTLDKVDSSTECTSSITINNVKKCILPDKNGNINISGLRINMHNR